MLDAGPSANEMVHGEFSDVVNSTAESQPDNRHLVVTRDVRVAPIFVAPFVRSNPSAEDQHTARSHVRRDALDGRGQLGGIRYVPDAAEEAGDRIELASKVQLPHVSKMDGHTRQSHGCPGKHRRADIRAFYRIPLAKFRQVGSCAARNVQKRSSGRIGFLDDLMQLGSLGGVILDSRSGVEQVIDPCALLIHGSEHSGGTRGKALDSAANPGSSPRWQSRVWTRSA